MLRKVSFIFFLIIPFLSTSQNNSELSPFFKAVELKSADIKVSKDLNKARAFFLQQQWDSTLLYSAKYIDSDLINQRMTDYALFFKAYSLRKRKIVQQAALEFDKISKDFDFYERVFFYKGSIALELEQYQIAIQNFERALDSIDSEAMIGVRFTTINNNLGICYLQLREYQKANQYLLTSIEIVEKQKDTLKIIGAYTNLANLYYIQKFDDVAIPFFKKAYDLSKFIDDFDVKRKASNNMAVVEENREDYIKALQYRKEYEQWKDSLNDQNRIYETAQLEKKKAVEQKEKEVQLLEVENKAKEAQNRVYLYSGILLGILLIIVFVSYRGTAKRNKIITAQKEDLDQLNATKDKLFSIVSHDLRSSVNAIKTSNKKILTNLETQDKQEITTSLQQNSAIVNGAYGLLDNLLNWALLQTQQTYFEMTDLSLYHIVAHVAFNYQSMLKEKDIAYVNSISRKTQVFADQESLKIILRNLLDNAIKFSEESGKIHIYSEESKEGYVDLVVEDSGLGMDGETKKELLKDTQLLSKKKHEDSIGTGLGMHLVKSMIAKNQGKFNIESELGKGTKMIVSLKKMEAV